jgi:hypothetical protein
MLAGGRIKDGDIIFGVAAGAGSQQRSSKRK